MNGIHKQRRPAVEAGRQVEQQIALASTAYTKNGVPQSGITARPLAPLPRDRFSIARDLRCAAEALAEVAERVADGEAVTSTADALLVGAGRLVTELRARGGTA